VNQNEINLSSDKNNNLEGGDILSITPYSTVILETGKVALLPKNNKGWLIVDPIGYDKIKNAFKDCSVRFSDKVDAPIKSVINSLWKNYLLTKNGQVLINPTDFSRIIRKEYFLTLNLTEKCNYSCLYCYDFDPKRFALEDIDISLAKNAIKTLINDHERLIILFHGGEPLLRFNKLKEIVLFVQKLAKFNKKRVSFSVQTNGSKLNKEIIEFSKENQVKISVSLDGHEEQSNKLRVVSSKKTSLQIFKEKLKKYPDFFQNTGILAVISTVNIKTFPDTLLWLQKNNIPGASMNFMAPNGRGMNNKFLVVSPEEAVEMIAKIIKMIKKKKIWALQFKYIIDVIEIFYFDNVSNICNRIPCGAGQEFISLDSNGYRMCHCTNNSYMFMGNVDKDLEKIKKYDRSKINKRDMWLKNNICKDCPYYYFCGGTCVAEVIEVAGTDKAINEITCAVRKYLCNLILTEMSKESSALLDYYHKHTKN
jgi:uncharacterized protein